MYEVRPTWSLDRSIYIYITKLPHREGVTEICDEKCPKPPTKQDLFISYY